MFVYNNPGIPDFTGSGFTAFLNMGNELFVADKTWQARNRSVGRTGAAYHLAGAESAS